MLLSLSATYSIGTCLLRLLPIDRSDVHLPFGADPDIYLGTFVSVFILFLAALTFVCAIVSNVDESDLLS